MKLTVVWTSVVERDLAELWLRHPAWRSEITQTANQIDALLRSNPETLGESRFDNVRFYYASPLAIDFRVVSDDRRVEVIGVTFVP